MAWVMTEKMYTALQKRLWMLEDWRGKATVVTTSHAADLSRMDGEITTLDKATMELAAQMAGLDERIEALLADLDQVPLMVERSLGLIESRLTSIEGRLAALEEPIEPPEEPPDEPPVTPPVDVSYNLQEAIRSAGAGAIVRMPAGIIKVPDIALKSDLIIAGQGLDTLLDCAGEWPFRLDGLTKLAFHDFALKGPGQRSASHSAFGVGYGASASDLAFRRLDISQMGVSGIWGSDTSRMDNVTIEDCDIHDNGDLGVTHGRNGSALNWVVRRSRFHGFAGRTMPPHGFYGHNFTGLLMEDCEGYGPLGDHPNGYSAFEFDDSTVIVRRTYAHDCKTTAANGFGFIVLGSGTALFEDCRGERNVDDFYECAYSGIARYVNCIGTKRIWP